MKMNVVKTDIKVVAIVPVKSSYLQQMIVIQFTTVVNYDSRLEGNNLFSKAAFNDVVRRTAQSAANSPLLEPVGLDRENEKRPDGISVVPSRKGSASTGKLSIYVDTYAEKYTTILYSLNFNKENTYCFRRYLNPDQNQRHGH